MNPWKTCSTNSFFKLCCRQFKSMTGGFSLVQSIFILISTLLLSTSSFALPEGFTKLHVNIAESCSLVENVGKTEEGPFEKLTQCQEQDFVGLHSVTGKVYRVVDGDTIHFYVNGKLYGIRMLGMDTPELHFYGKAQPTWGLKARSNLLKMVQPGDIIRGEFDQVKCDRYGRMLLHVYKNKVDLNLEQVRDGYAVNYCIAPNLKHCDTYAQEYRNAVREKLGMHRDRCLVTPYVWRRAMMERIMDKKVKDSETGLVVSASQYYKIPIANRIFYPAATEK